MNHITECIIVRTIYFLIIRCRFVPSERSVLHRHSGISGLFYLKTEKFGMKVCLHNHCGCTVDQEKHTLKSVMQILASLIFLLFKGLAIWRADGSAPWRAQQPSASSWPTNKTIWDFTIKSMFSNAPLCKLWIDAMACIILFCDNNCYVNRPFVSYIKVADDSSWTFHFYRNGQKIV